MPRKPSKVIRVAKALMRFHYCMSNLWATPKWRHLLPDVRRVYVGMAKAAIKEIERERAY